MSESVLSANIYGDSLMKGTVFDSTTNHYRATIMPLLERISKKFRMALNNRSRFGFTIKRGRSILDRDLKKGMNSCNFALIEYGGNDCDFDWHAISENPEGEFFPKTSLDDFVGTLKNMAVDLKSAGVTPVLMTLPPIVPERYLEFIVSHGADRENVLKWLGDVNMIYRYHEMYSNAIMKLAYNLKLHLVDVRSYFLDKHNFKGLMSVDGIHANENGYALMCTAFEEHMSAHL